LSLAEAPAAPQNARSRVGAAGPLFARFSCLLPPFRRFNGGLNRVECSPLQKGRMWHKEGEGKEARSQHVDCGLDVDWRVKLRGKPPETLCADRSPAWTICPSSTAQSARVQREKRTVYNQSLLHSFSTALKLLSSSPPVPQSCPLQTLAPTEARVLHDNKAPLLL
jgi:hypothetical protein